MNDLGRYYLGGLSDLETITMCFGSPANTLEKRSTYLGHLMSPRAEILMPRASNICRTLMAKTPSTTIIMRAGQCFFAAAAKNRFSDQISLVIIGQRDIMRTHGGRRVGCRRFPAYDFGFYGRGFTEKLLATCSRVN